MLKAIYIVYHQLVILCDKNSIPLEMAVKAIMENGLREDKDEIQEMRLFVPNYQNDSRPWRKINELQKNFGVNVETCPVLTEETEMGNKMKDAVDASLSDWVDRHLHSGVTPNQIILVTGDSDWVLIAHKIRSKKKKVEFWSVDPSSVNALIKRIEAFKDIKAFLKMPTENPFISALGRFADGGPLEAFDEKRLELMRAITKIKPQNAKKRNSSAEAVQWMSQKISKELGVSENEGRQMIEALLSLNAVKIFPVVDRIVEIDVSSSVFHLLE